MESWRRVWREGIAPLLSLSALEALEKALASDDARLVQGQTTSPPALLCVQDWPVECACAIAYAGWQGEHLASVGAVEEYFARKCFEIDQRMGEPAGCRWFMNWFDDCPRGDVFHELLQEVRRSLRIRRGPEAIKEYYE